MMLNENLVIKMQIFISNCLFYNQYDLLVCYQSFSLFGKNKFLRKNVIEAKTSFAAITRRKNPK